MALIEPGSINAEKITLENKSQLNYHEASSFSVEQTLDGPALIHEAKKFNANLKPGIDQVYVLSDFILSGT